MLRADWARSLDDAALPIGVLHNTTNLSIFQAVRINSFLLGGRFSLLSLQQFSHP
jgi:hypothetical protein